MREGDIECQQKAGDGGGKLDGNVPSSENSSDVLTRQASSTSASNPTPEENVKESKESDDGRILVEFEKNGDEGNPLCWSTWKKARVLGIISMGSMCVTCASSVVSSTYTALEAELGVSHEVAILGLSLFVAGLGLGPTILAPFSEFYGRRPIYLIAYGWFFLLGFPVSFAPNIAVFLIFRFLTGFVGSAFLSVAGGSVSDMWTPRETLLPMAFYTATPFLGPSLGPIYGGFIESFSSNFRWCFWVISIWSFLGWIALLVGAPETYAPIVLSQRARQLRKSTGQEQYYAKHEEDLRGKSLTKTITISGTRVFSLLILEPSLLFLCVWCALLLGILYLFFELFPIVFGKHNFLPYQSGLTFFGIALGILIALATMPYWARRFERACQANGGMAPPEARLDMAKVGAFLSPIGLFIFAFTSMSYVHWIGPVIGSIPFGAAFIYVYVAVFSYTVVQWKPVAASAMGANSFTRSAFAAGFPLFANQMAARLSTVGTAGLLAGLNCLLIPLPFIFAKYGARMREKSRFVV